MSAKFNFKENLLKASNDENIDIAIKEWLFFLTFLKKEAKN